MQKGDSIASEGKGEYMFVEGSVLNTSGVPIPAATIDTWETDSNGLYDTQVCLLFSWEPFLIFTVLQYSTREVPDCRGRLHSADDGSYAFRAVVFAFFSNTRGSFP